MQNAKSINNLLPSVQCGLCDETFSENKTASLHLLANHNTTKQFLVQIKHDEGIEKSVSKPIKRKCKSCEKLFTEEKQLQSHIKSFHKERKLSCNVCLEAFSSREDLKRHILDIHIQKKLSFDNSQENNYQPPQEEIEITTEKDSHDVIVEKNKQFTKDSCSTNKSNVVQEKGTNAYACTSCSKTFGLSCAISSQGNQGT